MPILQPVAYQQYDPVETVLNFARVIANDCALTLAGNLLADTQPYTLTMLQLAWRELQNRLVNNSIEKLPDEAYIYALPVVNSSVATDPAVRCILNSQGYFDGAVYWPLITLPPNLLTPLKLWERVSGSNAQFIPMYSVTGTGIPDCAKSGYSRVWEWRNDQIFFPGSTQVNDLRIRFNQFLSDPTGVNAPLPILRCANALAYCVVEVFSEGRGSTQIPVFQAKKEDAIKQLINFSSRKKQRENFRRQPYSRRGSRGSNSWNS